MKLTANRRLPSACGMCCCPRVCMTASADVQIGAQRNWGRRSKCTRCCTEAELRLEASAVRGRHAGLPPRVPLAAEQSAHSGGGDITRCANATLAEMQFGEQQHRRRWSDCTERHVETGDCADRAEVCGRRGEGPFTAPHSCCLMGRRPHGCAWLRVLTGWITARYLAAAARMTIETSRWSKASTTLCGSFGAHR